MTLEDFILPFGGKLDAGNRWVKLAALMPWDMIEDVYARSFKNKRRDGRPAIPARIAFGSLHIQASECFTDEKVVENISENPYLQYFLGLHEFQTKPLFDTSMMTYFRKRFTADDVAAINEDRADFYIVNFANCDMVGHTGVFDAAVKAVEAVDDALSKVVPAILAKGGFALITADHGNADHMFDVASDGSKHPFTAHTTNRVPFIIVDDKAKLTGIEDGRLSDIAPTMLTMAGIEPSAEMTGRVLATEA